MAVVEHVLDLLVRAEAAALGGAPDDADPPLAELDRLAGLDPVARSRARWLTAVAAGARGRYGAALDLLEGPTTSTVPPASDEEALVRAAMCATAASLLRQIGDHPAADPLDRTGLALLAGLPPALGPDVRLDCAVGATADAVGVGDLPLARTRLTDARDRLAVGVGWRPVVRLHWVETEVALLEADAGAGAEAAASAVALAEQAGAPRHLAKSSMFLGVARALTGDLPAGSHALRTAAELAERHRLLPLIWPVQAVLATMPGLAADPGEAAEHLRTAREAVRTIALYLPSERRERWTQRDPMAAFLLSDDSHDRGGGRQGF